MWPAGRTPPRYYIRSVSRDILRLRALAAVLCLGPAALGAQATTTVPVQDRVYRDLDRLLGAGLVQTVIVGQRPFSRREIARIVISVKPTTNRALSRIVVRLAREYAWEIGAIDSGRQELATQSDSSAALGKTVTSPSATRIDVNSVSLELLGANSQSRAIPSDATGSVAADINPLLSGRAGRTYRTGLNSALEGDASFRAAYALVFHASGRALSTENSGTNFTTGELLAGSGSLLWRNIIAEVGRQQFVWGQGMEGGLLGSTSGRALDMVRIANDTPFFAPSYLRHLGPLRGSLVLTDLGHNQTFPGSYIIAYKLSGNPFSPRFEFAASVLSEQGGRGAPSTSLINRFIDDIPLLQYTLPAGDKSHDQISNKFAGWEYRYRVPEWRGMQIYAEHQFDDMDPRRWKSTLWQDGGHIAGLSFADLGFNGAFSASAEYHHTGLRYYKHAVFTSGVAFNRSLIGDPLGNQGDGGYARLVADAGALNAFTLDAAYERRGGDVYGATVNGDAAHESNFRFVLLESRPAERRQRLVGGWEFRQTENWRGAIHGGFERVRNFAFVQGARRNNFLADLTVSWFRH
jgi:hypothetical protein